MEEFLSMGGYAAYIWPAWSVGVLILGGITLASIHRHRQSSARLAGLTATGETDEGTKEHG
ncbi:heme exporter protein CcmD [Alphaproteobacteria bacterium LSUCC0684]